MNAILSNLAYNQSSSKEGRFWARFVFVESTMRYPAKLIQENSGYVVTFRDIPEAITQGETLEEALGMAADALETAMVFYFEDARPAPRPSKRQAGEYYVDLPASFAAKILLLNEILAQNVSPSELAKLICTMRPKSIQSQIPCGRLVGGFHCPYRQQPKVA